MLITFLIVFIFFPCIFGSLLDNKASGALPFFQRQFWSCVKVFTLNTVRQRQARFSVKVKLHNGLLYVSLRDRRSKRKGKGIRARERLPRRLFVCL